MRRAAIVCHVPILSTLSAARAAAEGIRLLRDNVLTVRALQQRPGRAGAGGRS
jgi:hypothetical protein